MSFVVPHLQ